MLYDSANGHRVKHPYNHINWAHSALKLKDFNLQQCFFGEHLLKLHPKLPVSIVESEKTAIIASVYFPQFIWLATGGKHGCKWTTNQVSAMLKGRQITLWPDIKAYDDWQVNALKLRKSGLRVNISNLLEQVATDSEREAGSDIADFLIRYEPNQVTGIKVNSSDFEALVISSQPTPTPLHSFLPPNQQTPISSHLTPFLEPVPFLWEEGQGMRSTWPIEELESFFSSIKLPPTPIRLNRCTVIHDLSLFVSGHFSILHTHKDNPIFLSYLNRLLQLKYTITSSNITN